MVDDKEFREHIYNLVNGFMSLQPDVPESTFVQDAFAEGSFCCEAYGRVMDAYGRLCNRLQSKSCEDGDVEIIINEMNAIMKHISMEMFRCGAYFARREM